SAAVTTRADSLVKVRNTTPFREREADRAGMLQTSLKHLRERRFRQQPETPHARRPRRLLPGVLRYVPRDGLGPLDPINPRVPRALPPGLAHRERRCHVTQREQPVFVRDSRRVLLKLRPPARPGIARADRAMEPLAHEPAVAREADARVMTRAVGVG